jgi:hypothetical protein
MKYTARELRSKDHPLLRRLGRMSQAEEERREKDSGLIYEGFLDGKKDKEKKGKAKKFTKLHLYIKNSRSRGRG